MSTWRLRVSNPVVAIGCAQFALSILHVIFLFYYVKVFLNVFKVSQEWFNLAQVLFAIWNAINDPLFGYFQEREDSWMKSRTAVMRFFAPCLAVSFVLLWLPWPGTGRHIEGLHMITALFLYDAFFSAIGVAWSAYFTELSTDSRRRVDALKSSQLSILFSVNAVAIMEKLSHSLQDMYTFQVMSVVLASIAFVFLRLASSCELPPRATNSDLKESLLDEHDSGDEDKERGAAETKKQPHSKGELARATHLTLDVMRESDFLRIVFCNFLHIARSVAHMNFASIATEMLVPASVLPVGSFRISAFYGVCTLLPQIVLITGATPVVNRFGAWRVLQASFIVSAISAIVGWPFRGSAYCLMLFMLIDSITVHSTSPLFQVVIADFVDDDQQRNRRRSPISSFIFSLNALVTKPAVSLAPVLVVAYLQSFGYEDYKNTHSVHEGLTDAMQKVLFGMPLVLGLVQFFLLRNYTLRNKHVTTNRVLLG